jgi:hypothetical protein
MSASIELVARLPAIGSFKNVSSLVDPFSSLRSVTLSLLVAGIGFVLYFVCNMIYNVHFHPYAKYPGPFLARFTDLYAGYHAWKGDIHLDMWRCHQIYGDKVRYAPNRLNINTITGLKSNPISILLYNQN